MPHNSALPEWVVLIATRSGRRRDRTDRRPCHRHGRGDTLTVAGVPHLALGIDAPEGRQISQERRRPAASDLDNHCPARRLLIVCPIGSQPRRWRSQGTCILLDRHRKRSSSVSLSFKNSVTLRATSLVRLSTATVEVLPRWIVSRSDTTRERQLCADFVEKPLNRPLVEKWFRRCDSLV